jgi:hypothetical protein
MAKVSPKEIVFICIALLRCWATESPPPLITSDSCTGNTLLNLKVLNNTMPATIKNTNSKKYTTLLIMMINYGRKIRK